MSILEKIARVVFFPIYWMIDIREELMVMRYLMSRRTFGDLWEDGEQEAIDVLRASLKRGPKGALRE